MTAPDVVLGTASGERARRVAGTVHGFSLLTSVPLRLARGSVEDDGHTTLQVTQPEVSRTEPRTPPLRSWLPTPETPFSARLHELPDGFGMWVDGLGPYLVQPELSRILVPPAVSPARAEARLYGIPAALCFTAAGDLSLHAAAIEVDGRALLLTAPGRHGKTTLASAFLQAGYRVLSEDLCRLRVDPWPEVFPGPGMVRVRWDSYERLGPLPETEVVYCDEDRIHLGFTGDLMGDGRAVPVGAVVTLAVGDGDTQLERLPPDRAISDLWQLSFNLPTDADRARCFLGVAGLVRAVPVWSLIRPLDFAALPQLVDRLATSCVSP